MGEDMKELEKMVRDEIRAEKEKFIKKSIGKLINEIEDNRVYLKRCEDKYNKLMELPFDEAYSFCLTMW